MAQSERNDPCPCGSGKKYKKCCIGRPIGAAVKLIESDGGKKWSIKLMNFAKFDEALGTEVMTGFSRCFLHADRLVGLYSLAGGSRELHGEQSIAFTRDLHTMVWFAIGTLRELALALRDLRAALAKKKILNPKSPHWEHLRDLENRWDGDPKFREARNAGAFHVDQELIERGVGVLVKEERDVELSHGDGEKQIHSSFTLATAALHNGIGWDIAEYGSFLQRVGEDHGVVASAIQMAFVEAAEAVGINFGDET